GPYYKPLSLLFTDAPTSELYTLSLHDALPISIWSMAEVGMAFRSTPTVPRPTVPLTNTSALVCRRFPLTRTSVWSGPRPRRLARSEEHTSELQSRGHLVCRLLLEKKKTV